MTGEMKCPHCGSTLDVSLRLKVQIPGEVLLEDVTNLTLSLRLYNVLDRAAIRTLGELIEWSEWDMRKIKGCGKKMLAELKGKLAAKGLGLRPAEKKE
jgi:DNA-directed RNA polymerase alpha subunit